MNILTCAVRITHVRARLARYSVPVLAAGLILETRQVGSIIARTEASKQTTDKDNDSESSPTGAAGNQAPSRETFDVTEMLNDMSTARDAFLKRVCPNMRDGKTDSRAPSQDTTTAVEPNGFLQSAQSGLKEAVQKTKSLLSTSLTTNSKDDKSKSQTYQEMGSTLISLMSCNSNSSIDSVVEQVRDMDGRGEVQDGFTMKEVYEVTKRCADMLNSELSAFFGEEGRPPLYLTSLMYYVEREDQRKNPSQKRRQHLFFPGIDIQQMDEMYDQLILAQLGYADTVEEIKDRLSKEYNAELVYCILESQPNKPSHFIAVKRDQSGYSSSLEVLIVVCGTKTVTDVVTDLLCRAGPYKGGFAHSGILESGQWIVEKHSDLLEKLRTVAKKKRIKLKLLGHSLGAGAATIAGLEWNEKDTIDVQVMGFGCPALLSKDLSQKAEDIVTTVIADSDCVPRMSLATMVNALMDIVELDWTPYARQDFEETVREVQRMLPSLVNDSLKKSILSNLDSLLPDPSSFSPNPKRMEVVLFPPGRCIHFYRDGFGVTGSIVPCTFFDELEVTRRLVDDHLFDSGYIKIFLELMRQYRNDNYYTFEADKAT